MPTCSSRGDLCDSYPHDRAAADAAVPLPTYGDRPIENAPCATPHELEQQCREFAEAQGIKFGHLVHPVRAALTGTTKGAGLFDVVFLLGKQTCVERLRRFA